MNKKTILSLLLMLPLIAACASTEEESSLEAYNRAVFSFNEVVDDVLLAPVARGYRYITPQKLRNRFGNAANNLNEPVNFFNTLLQGDVDQAVVTFWRFALNSTVGVVGLHDVASTAGLNRRREDFGQTLAVWGVEDGGYFVLPILGPSTVRDAFGIFVDIFLDPFNYYLERDDAIVRALAVGLVQRERLLDPIDDIYATSLDPYSSIKSIYMQRRKSAILNNQAPKATNLNLN